MREFYNIKLLTSDEINNLADRLKQIDVTKGDWFIENTFADKNAWHLNDNIVDEGTYCMVIKKPSDIIKVLEHFGDKEWVDKKRLYEALMPAIRYFSYRHP